MIGSLPWVFWTPLLFSSVELLNDGENNLPGSFGASVSFSGNVGSAVVVGGSVVGLRVVVGGRVVGKGLSAKKRK